MKELSLQARWDFPTAFVAAAKAAKSTRMLNPPDGQCNDTRIESNN